MIRRHRFEQMLVLSQVLSAVLKFAGCNSHSLHVTVPLDFVVWCIIFPTILLNPPFFVSALVAFCYYFCSAIDSEFMFVMTAFIRPMAPMMQKTLKMMKKIRH